MVVRVMILAGDDLESLKKLVGNTGEALAESVQDVTRA